ncbi:MAG TPA: cell wall hydrolase [Allosphingosinicella sp.]|jgi:spore germination cell wall hydrolase CwlJ-like protein
MFSIVRAAGTAAALLAAILGTPSQAWEFETPTLVSSDLLATPVQGTPPLPTQAPAQAAPVAEAPAPAEPPKPQERPVRRSLSELVGLHSSSRTADSEQECLANAVYFESKGEPLAGQLSVAQVILNRAKSGRFASSVCGVVKQRGQFSFVRGGRLPSVPRASAAWKKAVAIAHIAREDMADSPASRALFFHATRVRPSWRGLKRVATVGNHIFYR